MKGVATAYLLLSSFLLVSANCATSYASIYSSRPISPDVQGFEPAEIQFSRIRGKEEGKSEMAERNVNNSDYDQYFKTSSYFRVNDSANVKVEYKTRTEHFQNDDGLPALLSTLTLFAIPVQTESVTDAEFVVYRNGVVVETYRYKINQTSFWGWLSIPLSTVLLPVANTVTEVTTSESLELHKRLINRFARDFYHSSALVNQGKVNRPGEKETVFLVLEGQNTASKYREQNTMTSNLLGLALVNGGYKIRDNEDLKPILKELSFSQSGLTRQNAIRIGEITGANKIITSNILYYHETEDIYKITIVTHVTDINTGEVEWKNLYTLEGENIESMLTEGSAKLLTDLRTAGYR
tara:strand:- start:886 stop:1941 length:1056 start_codon:yes stop_codon:yes gene_type:complete